MQVKYLSKCKYLSMSRSMSRCKIVAVFVQKSSLWKMLHPNNSPFITYRTSKMNMIFTHLSSLFSDGLTFHASNKVYISTIVGCGAHKIII